jgi:hypothetical protein
MIVKRRVGPSDHASSSSQDLRASDPTGGALVNVALAEARSTSAPKAAVAVSGSRRRAGRGALEGSAPRSPPTAATAPSPSTPRGRCGRRRGRRHGELEARRTHSLGACEDGTSSPEAEAADGLTAWLSSF